MADNIKYRFIQNVGDYFPSGYFGEDFLDKVQKCAGVSNDEIKALCKPFVALQHDYDEYKNFIINYCRRAKDAIKKTHDFHTKLLRILGYDASNAYSEHCIIDAEIQPVEMIPVRHILHQGSQVKMYIMEMQNLIAIDDRQPAGLFEQQYDSGTEGSSQQRYFASQWEEVFKLDKEKYKISPSIINKAVTQIFLLPEERRPHFILILAGNTVFLCDKDKWAKGSYLEFSLDELFAQARVPVFRNYYALFHLLVAKQTLASEGEQVLMDTIIEESYKNAYEVTKELKEGVVLAVEALANEALWWWQKNDKVPVPDYTDDDFESRVKDDCLTIIYRLLFLFYAESRGELEILPVNDEVYNRGYSLESLRDLEMVRLNSEESRNGYFFDRSIHHLFNLLADGHNAKEGNTGKGFRVRPIDSPLFNDRSLHHLADVKIRNIKWQEIICALSLSNKKNYCGRISYANLGVNQLGSVYESLLAFRGFYAEEDYIEVYKAGKLEDGTFLVPYSRMDDFDISEVLCDQQTGEPVKLPKGTFVYRLNGRDRQKSASYYTPEILTRSTVKYTLKSIIDEVRENKRKATELLELKILEPAMGAAAFQNEVINQLAEAYLTHQQRQQRENGLRNWRITPERYRDELQKVKAYIATHNVYGVDLNPTAIELGKLSLWLNVIHRDMETPFFANRLAVGNAVIGAWLKVYSKEEFYGIAEKYGAKLKPNKWWEKAPHKVHFSKNAVKRSVNEIYHFLLPDANMLGVRSIKEQKRAHAEDDKRMATILKNWTAAIGYYEFKTLQRISAKIDILLKEYFADQITIEKYTNNRNEVWDGIDHTTQTSMFHNEDMAESYAKKQRLFDTRYGHNNAYRKLKLVMDYWCALWFWEYNDTASLPTREEYWADIEELLAVDNTKLDARTRRALERTGSMVSEEESEYNRINEEEAQIVARTQEELLCESRGTHTLFADDDPMRFKIVVRLSERYRFFHPMLEFLEVFWLRDGFDIICGNPPWIKLEFNKANIIAEKYPEVVIRDEISAPDVDKMRSEYLSNETLAQIYQSEETECGCSAAFLNAKVNYSLLQGQQTDLYKCVLVNTFDSTNIKGQIGLILPESIYDDAKGQILRKELYHRLQYHFQYQNALNLFAIAHRRKYGSNIFSSYKEEISFDNINNLFHPQTIDACYAHDGHGYCEGIKDYEGKWNIQGHKDRIIHYTDRYIYLLSETFEDGLWPDSAKLVSIHNSNIIKILDKLSAYQSKVKGTKAIITVCWDETGAPQAGIIRDIKECTQVPDMEHDEMIYNAPHFYVSNPIYKTPNLVSTKKADFCNVDLSKINDGYIQKTKYIPNIQDYRHQTTFQGFVEGQDSDGNEIRGNWLDYYKVGFRKMVNLSGERSLICAVLPRRTAHINGVISISFLNRYDTVDIAALCASIVMDFYWKTVASQNITASRIETFPLGVASKYQPAIYSRTLLLNCLTKHYANLWSDCWREEYAKETWSINDARLKSFSGLKEQWEWSTPLRNYFERRQALVEIDVVSAMALGLSLEDLEMIYNIQFPVLQQNENDTWYDAKGNIVFTCSKGLTGVGLDRKRDTKTGMPGWEDIRGEQIDENTYAGASPTHTHTIDPKKSELYGGQQVTYYAPYTRCERIADYRRAWAHFEKIFNNE